MDTATWALGLFGIIATVLMFLVTCKSGIKCCILRVGCETPR